MERRDRDLRIGQEKHTKHNAAYMFDGLAQLEQRRGQLFLGGDIELEGRGEAER